MKIMCSMCKQAKDESEFKFKKHKGRYNSYCNDCERMYQRNYKRARREMEHRVNEQ